MSGKFSKLNLDVGDTFNYFVKDSKFSKNDTNYKIAAKDEQKGFLLFWIKENQEVGWYTLNELDNMPGEYTKGDNISKKDDDLNYQYPGNFLIDLKKL